MDQHGIIWFLITSLQRVCQGVQQHMHAYLLCISTNSAAVYFFYFFCSFKNLSLQICTINLFYIFTNHMTALLDIDKPCKLPLIDQPVPSIINLLTDLFLLCITWILQCVKSIYMINLSMESVCVARQIISWLYENVNNFLTVWEC